ncbi:YXWGXW repeat-containing protein [Comamonas resistens]|uniref:YXWGXW repeat-containing protein n=1 Tax=Comamonas resistens TaxID=3046670 RepID=A0ABY8SS81_9BURK|nr:YXWGXW repeat-containing protein [Comamonas resistens]MDL5038718.1 YXWGXW repeat-containing protein [Comamonas resistens]WHS65920.1 YXWGXW repeat-containing protein [Comamonas resistens]
MLTIRSTVQAALAASALALIGFAAPAQAHGMYGPGVSQGAFVNVQFGAPPPPRYEVVPAPRRGYIWAPGYWEPRGHRHVWRAGHWVQARPGYVYRPPTWSQHGGRWDYRGSRWDRDGDGVPNRYDRSPNNPYRR